MKMRFLAFFLTLCLIFSMVPANVFAVTFDGQDDVDFGEEMSTVADEEPIEEPSEESEEPSEESEEPSEESEEPSEEPEESEEPVEESEESEEPKVFAESDEPSEPVVPGEGCTAYEDGMHIHAAVVTAPTCTKRGYTTYTCACGDTYAADYVKALGHKVEFGVCVNCGEGELIIPVVTASNVKETGKVKLTWNSIEGAAKYEIYRSTKRNGKYTRMYTTTKTEYTNLKAEAGVTYYYKVVALNKKDKPISAFSEVVFRTCDLAQPVVTASNVAESGKIRLTWESVEGAVGYQIYRATKKNGKYTSVYTTTKTRYTNLKAEAGVAYYYKVVALAENTYAKSAPSSIVSRTCDLAQPVVTASNVAETGNVQLTWKHVEGAVSYKIYRSTSKNGEYKRMHTTTGNIYTNIDSTIGATYYYRVKAIAENTKANSVFSAIVKRTADCPKPTITGGADVKTGKPRLNWEPVEGAVQYEVYRSTKENGTYKLMYITAGTTYQNTKSEVGKVYYYKVKAVGATSASASKYSNMVSIMCASSSYEYVYSSYTTTKDGTAERNTNLTLSCKAINGTILAPGDTFSFNEIVGPRTASKGYQPAPIVGGTGRGGGICQVSTTLFNVALLGNMEITQRRQHSVAATYVPLGRDAMIYKTASDFKFVNSSPYYIKVVASSSNGVVNIALMTREPNVSPVSDVELVVTNNSGTYILNRYYKGEVNYTCRSKYK